MGGCVHCRAVGGQPPGHSPRGGERAQVPGEPHCWEDSPFRRTAPRVLLLGPLQSLQRVPSCSRPRVPPFSWDHFSLKASRAVRG